MDLPPCFCTGEVCCIGGTAKSAGCWDQDGCAALSTKCCCCLLGFEVPPDNAGHRLRSPPLHEQS